ncbi:hypothetical protein B9Z55_001470 [Caenorhabditis nigoni]|uniref:Uncharacterized protein n=1 Tax=Caenorhabditis nigoni TaxID=1611254 RepID=A0A2G5VG22_9PELO|nr:hypothetical protein B9Z55_001470 [Caenorhabditis nigoni]
MESTMSAKSASQIFWIRKNEYRIGLQLRNLRNLQCLRCLRFLRFLRLLRCLRCRPGSDFQDNKKTGCNEVSSF